MQFRDSSGKFTNNPFEFLQQTKKYPPKKIKELTEIEKAEIDFELDYMIKDYLNKKCLSKIILEYFPHFCKKYNLNIKINDAYYISNQNVQDYCFSDIHSNPIFIQLKKPNFDFKNQISIFLNLILNEFEYSTIHTIDNCKFYIKLYPRNRIFRNNIYRMLYGS